jgi:hypothetical protein
LIYFFVIRSETPVATTTTPATTTTTTTTTTPPVIPPAPSAPVIAPFVSGLSVSTPVNDGNGNTIYLDRHNINCNGLALNKVKLTNTADDKFKYDYTCSSGGNFEPKQDKTTSWNSEGGGQVIFLDRHNIDCGEKSTLSGFSLNRKGDGNFQYKYSCLPSKEALTCRKANTELTTIETSAKTLDKHNINCNSDEALSQIQLHTATDGKIQYKYTCCKKTI